MATSSAGRGCGVLFLLPFVLVGLGVFIGLGVVPMWRSSATARWVEVPCTIDRAEVETERDSEGDLMSRLRVAYTYRVQGVEHRSERFSFGDMWSNVGTAALKETVERYRQQPAQRCWVDPADATSAVLDRGVSMLAWFGLLFGAIFGGIPGLILVFVLRSWRRARRRAAFGEQEPLSEAAKAMMNAPTGDADTGPLRLAASDRKGCGVIALLGFAVVWNAVSWMGFLSMGGDWFGRIFLSLFILIGAGLALVVIYQFLALLNPLPVLEFERGGLRAGQSVTLRWSWTGNHRRMTSVRVELIGREEATYRRGTDTTTDKRELARVVLAESVDVDAEGSARVRLPAEALPSFAASNNRVVWAIRVVGEVPRFPDVDREFAFPLLPAANGPLDESTLAEAGVTAPDGPIVLAGGRTAWRPGDSVTGRIRWSLPEARTRLELRLYWRTAGKGTADAGVVDTLVVDAPGTVGDQDFALRIPAAGPVSCSGQLVSVIWALELVAEPGGALGSVDLVVGPTGIELRAP